MRELKFRTWDKLAKKMIHFESGYLGHYILTPARNGWEFQNLQNGSGGKEYEVQQYTGCKDKDGKEIYEGDILIYEEDTDCNGKIKKIKLVCQYQPYNAWFGFYEPKEKPEDIYEGYYWMEISGKCKVIGNIHENPKLLYGSKS